MLTGLCSPDGLRGCFNVLYSFYLSKILVFGQPVLKTKLLLVRCSFAMQGS